MKRLIERIKQIKTTIASKKPLGKAVSVSIVNQMVSSGTNFLLGIYLVRVLTTADYGFYGIGFAISIFFAGVGDSLFLGQMVVHMPDKQLKDRLPYAARMFVAVIIFCLMTVSSVVFVFGFGGHFYKYFRHYTDFAYAVVAASLAFHLKDFFVRHYYNLRQETHALEISIVVAVAMFVLLERSYFFHEHMTVIMALWIYSIANLTAAIYGFWRAKLPLAYVQSDLLMEDWKEAWKGGKWMVLSNVVYSLRTQGYVIVVGGMIGTAGVGMLNACRLLVMPTILFTPALSQVFSPRLNSLRVKSPEKVVTTSLFISGGLMFGSLGYSIILLLSYKNIVPIVLGQKYEHLFGITACWCFYTLFLSVRSGMEMMGLALKHFARLMMSNAGGAIVALSSTVVLVKMFSLPGAIVGLSLGDIFMAWLLWSGKKARC